ncbi:oligosaccharide flippase family protein [Vibrio sp. 10N.286.48.C11]|uniref:lipopolysaccharide biosynthesis protein n=1 Tax=Vibrio sp. 10N.286.48.C11 TaxID=3229698 RepID=UPI00354F4D2E
MKINRVAKDFINYFISDLFVKGFLFISLPLLSWVLSPEDYGILSLITSAISILFVFFSFNIQNAVYNKYLHSSDDFGSYLFSNLLTLFPIQILTIGLFPFYHSFLSKWFGLNEFDLFLVVVVCFLMTYFNIYCSYLQASRQSRRYAVINITSKLTEVILMFLIAYCLLSDKYLSKVYASIIVFSISMVIILPSIFYIVKFKFEIKFVKDAFKFSIPLIPHVLATSLLAHADRIIINDLLGSHATGIYSFSYNLGMAVIVVVMAWNSSWQPRFFELIKSGSNLDILKVTRFSCVVIFCVGSLLVLFSQEFVVILSNSSYYEGIPIIPLITISNALVHIYLIYANFTYYRKKTAFISLATLFALFINVLLNYLFIPLWGLKGAAWATILSYVFLCIFHFFVCRYFMRFYIVNFSVIPLFFFSICSVYILMSFLNHWLDGLYFFLSKVLLYVLVVGFSYKVVRYYNLGFR